MLEPELSAIIINGCGIGAALMGIAMKIALPRQPSDQHADWALIALLGLFAADMASSIFDLSPAAVRYPGLVWISLLLWPWMPVLVWVYVEALIRDVRQPSESRRMLGVAMAGTICLVPYFTLSVDARQALANGALHGPVFQTLAALAGFAAFFVTWMGSIILLGVKAARALAAHRRRMRELLSDVSEADLRWVDGLLLFVATGVAISMADNLSALVTGRELMNEPVAALFETSIVAGLMLFGVHQHRAVPSWTEETGESAAEAGIDAEPRYSRSSLTLEDCKGIISRLDTVMQTDAPWRNPMLNLKMLSERISTKPYYVTQALNTVLGRNFYDYVNGWRIRAAADELITGEASVLSICEDVGFNSKSTFNATFRKELNMTPSAYRQAHRLRSAI